ncbi:MAG: DUF116 domain-containing protein [Terracidiphilus sp.]|nr:DUF116 domain-containing protein [Terracidiphilus sp.]
MRQAKQSEQSMTQHIYDLRDGSGSSDAFYAAVGPFADRWLEETNARAADAVNGYAHFVTHRLLEAPRSRAEYAIEFLTLGMLLQRYEAAARGTPYLAVVAARLLLAARRYRPLKSSVDAIRALLHGYVFAPAIARDTFLPPGDTPFSNLKVLVYWLYATGEFEQEARRLDLWRRYLATVHNVTATRWLSIAQTLFCDLARDSESTLGSWTRGVSVFLDGPYARRGCRENQIFCGRTPAEYHLNMIAAEVMNRGLRPSFLRTRRRILLVPACMRGKRASRCRAHVHGVDITCTACDPDCYINRLTQRLKERGVETYIVPHSTGFSRWLDRWERESCVGVTAVACLLNILPGGYEMRARNIASQCVPLDFPGCRTHWDPHGISTGVHEDRLIQIASAKCTA